MYTDLVQSALLGIEILGGCGMDIPVRWSTQLSAGLAHSGDGGKPKAIGIFNTEEPIFFWLQSAFHHHFTSCNS